MHIYKYGGVCGGEGGGFLRITKCALYVYSSMLVDVFGSISGGWNIYRIQLQTMKILLYAKMLVMNVPSSSSSSNGGVSPEFGTNGV